MEIDRYRPIQNLGMRPYNASIETVSQEIKATCEKKGELSVFLLKPGYFSLDHCQQSLFQSTVEGLITASGLDIITTSCIALTTEQIHGLYPFIFGPGETPVPDFVLKLREDLESYMSDYVFSYLVFGEDAQYKLEKIKKALRDSIGCVKGSLNVKNAIHLAEKNDAAKDIEILFLCDNSQFHP